MILKEKLAKTEWSHKMQFIGIQMLVKNNFLLSMFILKSNFLKLKDLRYAVGGASWQCTRQGFLNENW